MNDTAPHPELAARGSFEHLRLGKQPPKDDARTLRLAKYLDEAVVLPAIPPVVDYFSHVESWPMYGNDMLGDCTCAAVGHMIQAWSAAAGGEKVFDDADVEELYWATGSPPADSGHAGGPTDTGRFELDVLNYWRKTGIGPAAYADRIGAFAALDPQNEEHVRAAVYLFGGLYIGIALPKSAQGQEVWDVVGDGKTGDSQPGSWGGHAVDVVGFDADALTVVTWGATHRMTWAFWKTYVDEAYALIAPDWLAAGNEMSAIGFDAATLQTDLVAIEDATRMAAYDAAVERGDAPVAVESEQETGNFASSVERIPGHGTPTSEIRRTAPVMPWSIGFERFSYFLQKLPGGGMTLTFAPSMDSPHGLGVMPPGIPLDFSPDDWERFQRQVATNGDAPIIQTATTIEGRML